MAHGDCISALALAGRGEELRELHAVGDSTVAKIMLPDSKYVATASHSSKHVDPRLKLHS